MSTGQSPPNTLRMESEACWLLTAVLRCRATGCVGFRWKPSAQVSHFIFQGYFDRPFFVVVLFVDADWEVVIGKRVGAGGCGGEGGAATAQTLLTWSRSRFASWSHSLSHSLILSLSHSLILSFSHSLILSFSHSLILSFSRSLILSFSHSLILSFSHSFRPHPPPAPSPHQPGSCTAGDPCKYLGR